MSKVFAIDTATSCPLKWVWSTLYLNTGVTRSCHRTAESVLDRSNFHGFHNTATKLQDRKAMLDGHWPDNSCQYCRDLEQTGGVSDRLRHRSISYEQPIEFADNPKAIEVSPTLLEVYFNNTCNLGCVYCSAELSSAIEQENHKWGDFHHKGVTLINRSDRYQDLVEEFWKWFDHGFRSLRRLHILGGEPFYQKKEMQTLFDKIRNNPNPECELNIITNLMISPDLLEHYRDQFREILKRRCLKKIDITCSIDCWGPAQEYVRWGLDLELWERNFQYLLQQKWLTININQTVSVLTIKTMPELLQRLSIWRKSHRIGHWFSEVSPGPSYLKPHILGKGMFEKDFDMILSLMPTDTEENTMAHRYMSAISNRIMQHEADQDAIDDLFVFLREKDRRRGTDWQAIFPWLQVMNNHVV